MTQVSTGANPRQIAINGSGGAWVEIDATCTSYWAEAVEDAALAGAGAGVPQGLQYQLPVVVDGVVTWPGPTYTVVPSEEPVGFGDVRNKFGQRGGPVLAQLPQPIIGVSVASAAGAICRMKSATVTATTINFTEYQ